ncbi:MAG: NFACT RNA binding domain-containing protein [Acholeplasmataceae bacterium]
MALDGIFTKYLIEELNLTLINNRLEEVYYNNENFIFRFYHQKVRSFLNINLNARFVGAYLVKKPLSKDSTNNFLTVLKRNLEGAILNNITQYKTDRVFIFNFTFYDLLKGPIKRELIFEAMGKYANLILVEDNIIIDVYKRNFNLEGRMLVPKASFNFFKSDKEDAYNYQKNTALTFNDISNQYLGVSQRLAKYLFNHHLDLNDLTLNPTLSIKQNRAYFFNIFNDEVIHYNTLSEALENRLEIVYDTKTKYENFIDNYLSKIIRKKSNLLKQMDKSNFLLKDKDKADLIYSSGLNLKEKYPFYKDISLDPNFTLNENAQKFYRNYHKGKRGVLFIQNEIKEIDKIIDTFNSFKDELNLTNLSEVSQFDLILKPYGFLKKKQSLKSKDKKHLLLKINYQNITYIVGKNSYQNEIIINTLGKPNDYWFHIKDGPGSHVLVKTLLLTDEIIINAATLAAHFSSFKDSSSIPVNYTLFKNIRKIKGMPASFVKIKNEKTIFIDIDKSILNKLMDNA